MLKFISIFIILLSNLLYSFTIYQYNTNNICGLQPNQINKLLYIYNYSKKFKAADGMTFNEALSTIFLVETSLKSKNWLGDIHHKDKISYLVSGSFGPGQIRLATALKLIKEYPYLFNKYGYLYHDHPYIYQKYNLYFTKMKYYYKILNNKTWKKRWNKGKKLKVKEWAEKEFKYWGKKYKKYVHFENKDLKIIQKLKSDLDFSIDIGIHLLLHNYKLAKTKGLTFPYYRSISAYNGGWENKNYLEKFFKYRKFIKCIEKEFLNN